MAKRSASKAEPGGSNPSAPAKVDYQHNLVSHQRVFAPSNLTKLPSTLRFDSTSLINCLLSSTSELTNNSKARLAKSSMYFAVM